MYSQNNEEEIILNYFKDKPIGTILDIGANDGKMLSNSLRLIEMGWRADLVEASPTAFKQLEKLHYGNQLIKCHNLAIVEELGTGSIILHESGSLITENDYSLVSTVIPSEKDRWNSVQMKWKEVSVKAVDFTEFIFNNSMYDTWDLITIDIEGKDYEVLKQIDLNQVECKMLIVEWNSKPEIKQQFINYAHLYGMKKISQNAENLIFVK